MRQSHRIDVWLKRTVLALCACFMVVSSVFVWRLSTVLHRIEHASSDIQQITGTAAKISEQLGDIVDRVEALERTTGEVLARQDIEHLLEEVVELSAAHGADGADLDPTVEREINALLAHVAGSGLRVEYGGQNRSAGWVAIKLHAKRRLYRRTIASAEDFIQNVASGTMTGDRYYVLQTDGTKQGLDLWLLAALRDYRSRSTEEGKTGAQDSSAEARPPTEAGQ